uniref:Glycosyltransferase family 92 protein n=2 Tax=Caenorhabditis japonica TaxID=281687 RepID=A0A8R1DTD0_CAEJA
MESKSIFRTCKLFLLILVNFSTQNVGLINMDPKKPMDILHGEYKLPDSPLPLDKYHPTWATVWPLDDEDFQRFEMKLALWPPKYCHAVFLCPVPKVDYTKENFKTQKDMCENKYIKYYPQTKQLVFKADAGSAEVSKYWLNDKLRAFFNKTASGEVFAKFQYSNILADNFNDWMKEIDIDSESLFPINITNSDLLILTNSRMCRVVKVRGAFYPFFKDAIEKDTSKEFPSWIFDGAKYVNSDALFPTAYSETSKTFRHDLLQPLKDKQWHRDGNVGQYTRNCNERTPSIVGMMAEGQAPFMTEGVYSVGIHNPPAAVTAHETSEIYLEVGVCHWFRIWITSRDNQMDKYKDSPPTEYITVFLNEGFFVGPNSDIAHPLPDPFDLTIFRLRGFLKMPPETGYWDGKTLEMAMGSNTEPFVFREYIRMDRIKENSFNMHVITAPGCSMKIGPSLRSNSVPKGVRPINRWKIENCQYTFYT